MAHHSYPLTGRTRYRPLHVPWGPTLLVLQVEYEVTPKPDGPYEKSGWRDAMVEDLADLERIKEKAK